MYKLIERDLLYQQAKRADEIAKDPFIDSELRKRETAHIYAESIRANAELEMLVAPEHSAGTERDAILAAERISDGVRSAWEYGVEKFNGTLDTNFLLELGGMINQQRVPSYRSGPARMAFTHLMPPEDYDLHDSLDDLMHVLRQFDDPLEKAVYAHFHLFRLQPMVDGNKRLARTVQNLYLHDSGRPPAIVLGDDLPIYDRLIKSAYNEFYVGVEQNRGPLPGNAELAFYEFMAGRAGNSLRDMHKRLLSERKYEVELDVSAKGGNVVGAYHTAKGALMSLLRKRSGSGKVSLDKQSGILKIVGDLSGGEISAVLDSLPAVRAHRIMPFTK